MLSSGQRTGRAHFRAVCAGKDVRGEVKRCRRAAPRDELSEFSGQESRVPRAGLIGAEVP